MVRLFNLLAEEVASIPLHPQLQQDLAERDAGHLAHHARVQDH